MERKWRSIRTSPVGERMKRDWIIASNSVVFALIVSSSVMMLLFCWLSVVVFCVCCVGLLLHTYH